MFKIGPTHRTKWDSIAGTEQPISLVPINRGSLTEKKIFTIGSCFALEIRHGLAELGYNTFPKYFDIEFDSKAATVGKLPRRDNLNHYSIASIEQEFENISAETTVFSPDYFYELSGLDLGKRQLKRFVNSFLTTNDSHFDAKWQDPFRKQVFAAELDDLKSVSNKITEKIRNGVECGDVFVITLGMTEVWRDKKSGLVVCNSYGGKVNEQLCDFVDLSVEDVIRLSGNVINRIRGFRPEADVILTVSPVPLGRTAKNESVVTANALSKAKQRVAAAEVCARFSNVYYFPSFELSHDSDFFESDGRHVSPIKARYIIDQFVRWYEG